ncbi:MAG: MBL fold metallo-hydrolase [Anaerolineae bacterium]|nr:MBL fold metallo-hydrolase [Anaerolineae bacterium]
MKITFWGAARTVTGSQHLIDVAGEQVLLDCGLFQGRRDDANSINETFPFDPANLQAMVLSHAHIDHSGNIPNLVKQGFRGTIHATHATEDICHAMLLDSAKIQEEDAKFLNKRGIGRPVQPLYTIPDAEFALTRFQTQAYDQPFQVTPNMRVRFGEAGHMLGSAWEHITLTEGEQKVNLVFSGDLGRFGTTILRDPAPMPDADYLVIEGTYGGRTHAPLDDVLPDLKDAIMRVMRRGGKIVIPAFAVGRTQEIVYHLNHLVNTAQIPSIPVFVDSPLATNVTQVFKAHPECFNDDVLEKLSDDRDGDAFGFPRLRYIRQADDSKSLKDWEGPAIIITASGMCENGRVLHHLRNTIEDKRNMVLFVSFQAPGTLGRRILDGEQNVRILGESFRVRAEIHQIQSFSGHADSGDLLKWVQPKLKSLRKIFIVHAEIEQAEALARAFQSAGAREVHIPARGQGFVL